MVVFIVACGLFNLLGVMLCLVGVLFGFGFSWFVGCGVIVLVN